MARKIDKIYSSGKLVKIIIGGEEKAEKAREVEKILEVKQEESLGKEKAIEIFMKIPPITKKKALALYNAGIKSLKELSSASNEKLLSIKEITIKDVKAIKSGLKGFYEEVKPEVVSVKKITIPKGLKTTSEKIVSTTTSLRRKIVPISLKALRHAKKGAFATKAKLKSTYKKLTAPEEEKEVKKGKAVKVGKVRRKKARKGRKK